MNDNRLNAAAPGADRGSSRTSETQHRSISDYSTNRVSFQAATPAPCLDDILATRMLIYGRLLAGAGLSFPLETIEAYKLLQRETILDGDAQAFLDTLVATKYLPSLDNEQASAMAIKVSFDGGQRMGKNIARWCVDAALCGQTPLDLVKSIASTVVAMDVLNKLKVELANGTDKMYWSITRQGGDA